MHLPALGVLGAFDAFAVSRCFTSRQQENLPLESLTWTVQADISARFTVVALPHGGPAQQKDNSWDGTTREQLILACIIQVQHSDSRDVC